MPRLNVFVACGCCDDYHRADFWGDCREDSERHNDVPDDAEVITLDEQIEREREREESER